MEEPEAVELVASLYDSLFACLVRYAAQLCGSVPVAEETVQDAFLLLYRTLRSGRRLENPRAWAFTVVRRALGRNVREPLLGRVSHVSLEYLDALPISGCPDPLPPGIEADDVSRLLAVLTPREREVILLRMAALRYREIGEELGISLKSVHTMLVRALRKLQKARREGALGGRNSSHVEQKPPKTLQ
jgi:RNA polymerase sigma-70 factor, ECF subfamily